MSVAVHADCDTAARQKKRARTAHHEDDERPLDRGGAGSGNPSEKYWFEDGNIVLRVEDTLFRVHRGMLSRHSTVFSDMFALPQPEMEKVKVKEEGEGLVEGCCVVGLPGDKVRDWERVLAILYDFDSSYKKQDEFPVGILASMLRLGRKYQFDGIFRESFEQIQRVIPTTSEQWNGLPKAFAGGNCNRAYVLLQVLREIGNQTLLPLVYYCCAAYLDTTSIFRFCRAISVDDEASFLCETMMKGREKLVAVSVPILLTWAFPQTSQVPSSIINNNPCRSPHSCRPAKQTLLHTLLARPYPYLAMMPGSSVVGMMGGNRLCVTCSQEIAAVHNSNRSVVWEKLPSFFDLPEWKDLKDL